MKVKQERIANIIYRNVAEILQFQLNDPDVGLVTITEVKVTTDLSLAKIFIMISGDEREKKRTLDALKRAKGFIRSQLAQNLSTFKTPDLKFVYDDTLEKANRLDDLIRRANQS